MAVSQDLQFTSLDELFLDPKNPRLGRHIVEEELDQGELQKRVETWKVDELAVSFIENGQFWTQEALICVREKLKGRERLFVVEGNRRLAALRALHETYAGKRKGDRLWTEIVGEKKAPKGLFERIPYLLADDRESVQAFLGFRHVTGIEEWKPAEKAEFIARLIDSGQTYDQVRRKIGSRLDTVRRHYISYRLLLQMEDADAVPVENLQGRFSVMYLSLRTTGVRTYLHIDIEAPPKKTQRPVPPQHLDALRNFALWLFGNAEREPLFTDSRQVERFGRVLESREAVEYLESSKNPSFDVAAKLSGGDEVEVAKLVDDASDSLELALSRAHHFPKSAKLQKSAERLGKNTKRLLEIFPGMKDRLCAE
ncbi:MAG: hypothetical protein ABMA13_10805 [Chthoniobacteraceae bacterium]